MTPPDVERLLGALHLADPAKYEMVKQVRALVQGITPESDERVIYGGVMFAREGADWGGVFAYKNHVTFEFGKGARFENPPAFLEGKGKLRRHIKLVQPDDIAAKNLSGLIMQALAQP